MIDWLVTTLRQNAELAIFLALAIGHFVGPRKLAGFNLATCAVGTVLLTIWGRDRRNFR